MGIAGPIFTSRAHTQQAGNGGDLRLPACLFSAVGLLFRGISVHEEIRLPFPVDRSHHILDERHMIRPEWSYTKLHVGFLGSAIPLSVITADARAHEVLPGIGSAARFGEHMIHSQRRGGLAAVDTAMVVPSQDVLPRKLHLLIWHVDIEREAYDAGIGIGFPHRMDLPFGMRSNQFCLAQPEENNRLLDVADAQRLVVLIQYQDLAIERRAMSAGSTVVGYRAERSELKPPSRNTSSI
jgi:hypothetical protein